MAMTRKQRILRQHIQTDRLLGVEAIPADGSKSQADSGAQTGPQAQEDEIPGGDTMADSQHDVQAKKVMLEQLDEQEVQGCTKCPLAEGRNKTVFGEGSPDADLMFIGEGPGRDEDLQGRPFVGRAGNKLNEMITAMGISREDVFIANVVKCRPPQNRTPTPVEIAACFDYLLRQISIIEPKVIVTLGAPATRMILDTKIGIMKLRGQWGQFDGLLPDGPSIAVMPTYHPAYLLRAYTMENRKKVWSDLQQVMDRLKESS